MAPTHLFVSALNGRTISVSLNSDFILTSEIKQKIFDEEGIPCECQRIVFNGRELHGKHEIPQNSFLELKLRLLGGKGGFGALLRGGNKTGKKVTNFDDCRDLNGRRIRHVKNEQKLKEWYEQQAKEALEKEKNKEKKKEWKPEITFDGNLYRKELNEIDETIRESVQANLKSKRKEEKKEKGKKRNIAWGGMEDFNESSSDEEIEQKNLHKRQKKEESSDEESGTESPEKEQYKEAPTLQDGEKTSIEEEKKVEETKEKSDSFCLEDYETALELESVGLEQLKKELMNRGMICGGNLKQRAERLFSVKGKKLSEIDSKLLVKFK